jgi:hypothetical protein
MSSLIESESEIRYANSGGVNVAYRVNGSGPVDLVYVSGWISHLEAAEQDPGMARFHDSLRSLSSCRAP